MSSGPTTVFATIILTMNETIWTEDDRFQTSNNKANTMYVYSTPHVPLCIFTTFFEPAVEGGFRDWCRCGWGRSASSSPMTFRRRVSTLHSAHAIIPALINP